MLVHANKSLDELIEQEGLMICELVRLFKNKTHFSEWPDFLYSVFWYAIQPSENQIETQKANNLRKLSGVDITQMPKPVIFEQDIVFLRSVDRVRADLARLIGFKAGAGL